MSPEKSEKKFREYLRQLKNSKCNIIGYILQRRLAKSEKMLILFLNYDDKNTVS